MKKILICILQQIESATITTQGYRNQDFLSTMCGKRKVRQMVLYALAKTYPGGDKTFEYIQKGE